MFEQFLSKFGFLLNKEAETLPKNLFWAGLLASVMCFILMMFLAGYETYMKEFTDKLFDLAAFSIILFVMSLVILPISFMSGMILVFLNKLLTYLFKIENEGYKWILGAFTGLLFGLGIFIFNKNLTMIGIFVLTGLWGASFVSFLSGKIVKKEKWAEKS